jgi:hypothetical protein
LFHGKRKFIFIPTSGIDALASPQIISVLLDEPNSILVLEDAEKAVVCRDNNNSNKDAVSTLLNVGDGILGSALNLSMIVTFNVHKNDVDEALLRKGRLLYEYKFDALSVGDSQKLIDSLGTKHVATEPMVLSDIYNLNDENNASVKDTPRIGF